MRKSKDGREILKRGNKFLCEAYNPDMRRARALKPRLPDEDAFRSAAQLLKACADPMRVKILYALAESELCVCELACLLDLSMPTVSHHLRLLNQSKLIRYRKEGKLVFYSLRDEHLNGTVRRLVESYAKEGSR